MPEGGRRLVVTGRDEADRSMVTSLDVVRPIAVAAAPGWLFERLWASAATPTSQEDGRDHTDADYYPEPGRLRVGTFTIPPVGAASSGVTTGDLNEAERLLPGGLAFHDLARPGFHRTATVDFLTVLSGQVELRLDHESVVLERGDVVVQRGTAHAWLNPGPVSAEVFYVMVALDPVGPIGPST